MKVFEIIDKRLQRDIKSASGQLKKDVDDIKKSMRYSDNNLDLGVSRNLKGVDARYTTKDGHTFAAKSDFRGQDPELSWNKKVGKHSELSASLGKDGNAKVGWTMKF